MKKLMTIFVATAIAAVVPQTGQAHEHGQVSRRDCKFICAAAEGNNAEIEMADMVARRTQDPQIRGFALKLIRDHCKANCELKKIANSKGFDIPGRASPHDEREIHRLAKKPERKFDREVIDRWVKDHKKDIREYQSAAKHADDPAVKQYASATLPVLHDHLANARALEYGGTINEAAGANQQY